MAIIKQEFAGEKENTATPLVPGGGSRPSLYLEQENEAVISDFVKSTMLAGGLTAGLAGMAFAGDAPRQIVVSGQGTVHAAPDMATITLGVTHEHVQAGEAMQDVSAAMTEMLVRLRELGLEDRHLQTTRITLNPVWSHHRGNDRPPEITGFVASNALSVQVVELENLGQVLDAVIAGGANDFNGLQFGIQEPDPLQSDARALAVADARAKAQELADAAGVTLGPVLNISEQRGGRVAPMHAEMSMRKAADVPVAAGEMSVSVSVDMVFGIGEAN